MARSALLFFALLAVPARAQNFQNGSAETIWPGNSRLTASPVLMFGRDGDPDLTGGAFRFGYGISDSFDVEAKTAFFDGVALVGGDGHGRLVNDRDTSLSFTFGGHQALVTNALDSTVRPRRAGQQVPRPTLRDLRGSGLLLGDSPRSGELGLPPFHLVPGLTVGIAERIDLLVEAGVGLNANRPHYVTAGLAVNVPVSATARRGRR